MGTRQDSVPVVLVGLAGMCRIHIDLDVTMQLVGGGHGLGVEHVFIDVAPVLVDLSQISIQVEIVLSLVEDDWLA